MILSVNREMGFDGIVLESWSSWAAYGILNDPELRKLVILST
jgi:chitinase domain-containing protein 1